MVRVIKILKCYYFQSVNVITPAPQTCFGTGKRESYMSRELNHGGIIFTNTE